MNCSTESARDYTKLEKYGFIWRKKMQNFEQFRVLGTSKEKEYEVNTLQLIVTIWR